MSASKLCLLLASLTCLMVATSLSGCGNAEQPAAGDSKTAGGLPTASIGPVTAAGTAGTSAATDPVNPEVDPDFADPESDSDDGEEAGVAAKPAEPGTPEFMLQEAVTLRMQPPPETDDVEKLRKHRRQRNEKIIDLTMQVMAATHNVAEQDRVFASAVQQMLEARVQLAELGDKSQVDALYENADALWQRDPKSQSASLAAFTLAQFAYTQARPRSDGRPSAAALQEFARLAGEYTSRFPKDEVRSLPLLLTAARSCELNGLPDEATTAYKLLAKKFPKTAIGQSAAAVLRRISLPGKQLELTGPTLDGGNFSIEDYRGAAVAVVFWSSAIRPEADLFPELRKAVKKVGKDKLKLVGICLDLNKADADRCVLDARLTWPQIFHPDEALRGSSHPVAQRYSIQQVPAIWLVTPQGAVATTDLNARFVAAAATTVLDGRPWNTDAQAAAVEAMNLDFQDEPAGETTDELKLPEPATKKSAP